MLQRIKYFITKLNNNQQMNDKITIGQNCNYVTHVCICKNWCVFNKVVSSQ